MVIDEVCKEISKLTTTNVSIEMHAAIDSLKQAALAHKDGNFPVGACLLDPNEKKIVAWGRNEVFNPYFNSAAHAEMTLMNEYEEKIRKPPIGDLVLYSSLEPCFMCMSRMLYSGVKNIVFLTKDDGAGAVNHLKNFPSEFQRLSKKLKIDIYDGDQKLNELAAQLFAGAPDFVVDSQDQARGG